MENAQAASIALCLSLLVVGPSSASYICPASRPVRNSEPTTCNDDDCNEYDCCTFRRGTCGYFRETDVSGNWPQCPRDKMWKSDDHLAGASVAVCCEERGECSSYTCPINWRRKASADRCSGSEINENNCRLDCCEPTVCSAIECGTGTKKKVPLPGCSGACSPNVCCENVISCGEYYESGRRRVRGQRQCKSGYRMQANPTACTGEGCYQTCCLIILGSCRANSNDWKCPVGFGAKWASAGNTNATCCGPSMTCATVSTSTEGVTFVSRAACTQYSSLCLLAFAVSS